MLAQKLSHLRIMIKIYAEQLNSQENDRDKWVNSLKHNRINLIILG